MNSSERQVTKILASATFDRRWWTGQRISCQECHVPDLWQSFFRSETRSDLVDKFARRAKVTNAGDVSVGKSSPETMTDANVYQHKNSTDMPD